ncbi:MAG TPA: hypothetical protein VFJ14_01700 [Nocardioidaceae bacterium]|nr:hypothetical protein [Nocardioidaceae bacterium]
MRLPVEALIDRLELDEVGMARASLARVLAFEIDEASKPGVVDTRLAGLVHELREVLNDITDAHEDSTDEWLDGLFAEVGDSP